MFTTHHFDIDAEPAQIVWGKREIDADERKGALISAEKARYATLVNAEAAKEVNDNEAEVYDVAVVAAAKVVRDANLAAIAAATTHEDLDALVLQ